MPTAHSAQTLQIEGRDAIAFAQNQFSSRVDCLAIGQWQFSAWLGPQGRVRSLFHLARITDDRLLLLLRGGDSAAMADALQRYVLRSKVSLKALPRAEFATGPALPMHMIAGDAETLTLGCESHSLQWTTASADDAWRLPQLRAGWPWLPTQLLDTLLPPALSLHRLHAVAIDKGCYPGQEIVARLHYRGGHKRHLHRVLMSHPAVAGEVMRIDDRDVGCVLDVVATDVGIEALVVLNEETGESAAAENPIGRVVESYAA